LKKKIKEAQIQFNLVPDGKLGDLLINELNIPIQIRLQQLILSFISVGVWWYYSNEVSKGDIIINKYNRISISSLAGFGPVIIAWILTNLFNSGGRVQPVKMNIFGNLLHLGVGTLFCSIPITYMCYLALE
jgi:hypothetical protein